MLASTEEYMSLWSLLFPTCVFNTDVFLSALVHSLLLQIGAAMSGRNMSEMLASRLKENNSTCTRPNSNKTRIFAKVRRCGRCECLLNLCTASGLSL